MANLTSKILVCGIAAIFLMLTISAIPTDGNLNNETNAESISVWYGTPSAGGDKWSWDETTCTLYLEDGLETSSISIYGADVPDLIPTAVINGTVSIGMGALRFFSDYSDVKIIGDGKIISECGYINLYCNNDYDRWLTIDGVDIEIHDGYFTTMSSRYANLRIQNCESVKLTCNNTGNSPVIRVEKKLEVINSNLYLENKLGTKLITAANGITMDLSPGTDFIFTNPGAEEGWVNGVTTAITGTQTGCSLEMESFVPTEPSSGNSINIYDVSLYSTVAAAVALIGIGCIYARKH